MKGLKKARMTSKKTLNYKSHKRPTRRLIGGKDPSIVPPPPDIGVGWNLRWVDVAFNGHELFLFDRETKKFLGAGNLGGVSNYYKNFRDIGF